MHLRMVYVVIVGKKRGPLHHAWKLSINYHHRNETLTFNHLSKYKS